MTPQQRRDQLYSLLGDLPPRNAPIGASLSASRTEGNMVIEHLKLTLNDQEPVPAYFVKPAKTIGRLPVILFNHSHGGFYKMGKQELLNPAPYMQPRSYAADLVERGFAVLAIDHYVFGERSGESESAFFKRMIWQGKVMFGLMVYDSLRAIDYLDTRPDVDARRLGTIGMSMGSTMAWWVAALDERVRACVDICCLTDFDALIKRGGLDWHGIYYYVPSLLKHFSAADINALIAPRPHLGLAGELDGLTPIEGLAVINDQLKQAYTNAGAPQNWELRKFPVAHQETPEMRQLALDFFTKHLR